MPSFAERYEAACQRDGTLRAVRNNGSGSVLSWTGGKGYDIWNWREPGTGWDQGTPHDFDAIAHATVAMLQWLLRVREPCWAEPYFDAMDDGTFNMRVSVGAQCRCENIDGKPLHECLIDAVEKVLDQ